ncbi:sigma-70 family RNA polymerase sigma factor [candidate division KSB1 bacterium]|nr:sigma-70 family RNA polymerase sigma factor [candidate division KSB1 bacterium]
MNEASDHRLIYQCLDGDVNAYETLVERYQRTVFNVAYRMTQNQNNAEEITQAIFVKAYEKLDTFNYKYKFFSWIYKMTVNETLNFVKRNSRQESLDVSAVNMASSENPEKALDAAERSAHIQHALGQLHLDHRTVLVLKYFTELSYSEMSEILQIPEKTVKSRLYSARIQLKDVLVNQGWAYNGG